MRCDDDGSGGDEEEEDSDEVNLLTATYTNNFMWIIMFNLQQYSRYSYYYVLELYAIIIIYYDCYNRSYYYA